MTPDERQELFTRIYQNNEWKGRVSRSGPGSDPEQIASIRKGLSFFLWSRSDLNTILDIPCGDFSLFGNHLPNFCDYIGGDIVPNIIHGNDKNFLMSPGCKRFRVMDLLTDELPKCDIIICRDCLPHFSYEDIWQALKNVCRTNPRYLITTTFFAHQNTDIVTGGWRPLNLQAEPFNFPAPEICLSEQCTIADGKFADKSLGVWRLENIRPCVYGAFPK